MRFPGAAILILAAGLAGCMSGPGSEELLALGPSPETTSSVARPDAPVPAAVASPATVPAEAAIAEEAAPGPEPEVPVLELAAIPKPSFRPMAAVAPEKPSAGRTRMERAQIYSRAFRDAKPINFGASSPRRLAVHGVDVSRWQGEIDWARLRTQGANFAYIKATDGGDHLDPMFMKNWKGAADAGLRRGAYHFFYWCRTAGEQADWFIRNVPRVEGALPPVIDVEWNGESRCKKRPSRARVLEKMQVFMDRLEAHYGQRPIIYTAPDFYRDNLQGAFPNHPFWLRSVAAHPAKIYSGRKWLFWQYSGSGLSHGVQGQIDLNVFHGSEEQWYDWLERSLG